MSNKKHKRPLSLEETVDLLGADKPKDVGPVHLDPLGIQELAAKVSKRLAKKRGRPTDPSWGIVRKVPMKETTWASLNCISGKMDPKVAPGQMAAIALEIGLEKLLGETQRTQTAGARKVALARVELHKESREEARSLCTTIVEERFW